MQVIHARCDEVMRLLGEELHLDGVKPYLRHDRLVCEEDDDDDEKLLEFERSFMVQMSDSIPPL